MNGKSNGKELAPDKLSLNLGIVGGGRACKFFLELLEKNPFPYLDIKIVGVCDINPEAPGFCMAQELGIYTTQDFRELFKIEGLDNVIEVTGSRGALLELIKQRPKGIGVIEHNVGRLLRSLVMLDESLKSAQAQLVIKDMVSDFIMQHTYDPVVVLNPDYRISEANEAYLKAVGKSRNEVLGAHCYEVSHGLSVPCSDSTSTTTCPCPMEETLRTGRSAHALHEHCYGDEALYHELVTYPVKNPTGEIVRVIEIWRDITEELSSQWKKRTDELKADLRKLIQEDRMISLGKLVASCVHEINNPIQGLLTFSHLMQQILAEGEPSPEDLAQFQRHLSLMSGELERCGDIVSGLLSFSRESTVQPKDLDLNDVLRAVVRLTRHKMELQDIDINEKLSDIPLIVPADINQMQQCFLNLIFNALEAMPQGGRLTVTSEFDTATKSVHIEIQDTGCGIADENLDRLFVPFFTTKEEGQGTGLGLSIVYGVVKNHKGNIEVKSCEGKGTTFTVRFPVQ